MPKLPKPSTLQWSQKMEDLHFSHVVRPVMKDKRTDWDCNVSLGYPFNVIRDDVIKMGLADFTKGYDHAKYGSLSADEKSLLYCFTNMKLHFFEALATFRAYKSRLQTIFSTPIRKLMIDLGCGPGTAGLALAECLDRPKMLYIGLDRSRPMLRKAESMLKAAIAESLLASTSQVATTTSWARLHDIIAAFSKPVNVLVNATYLFASDSLDIDDVCNLVVDLKECKQVRQLVFTYSNTEAAKAGIKFSSFKNKLNGEFSTIGRVKATFTYRKKRGSDPIEATYVRQLLRFKEG